MQQTYIYFLKNKLIKKKNHTKSIYAKRLISKISLISNFPMSQPGQQTITITTGESNLVC